MNLFKKSIFLVLLFPLLAVAQQKDTVTVMTYNLLYYRATTSFCTASNNSTSTKENAMEDIIDFTLPDILVVNEMGGSSAVNSFRLLQNSLNKNGRSNYSLANATGVGNQTLVNMLYYNTDKFILESQSVVDKDLNNNNIVRVIDIYNLIYNDTNLTQHQDTTRIHIAVAHLKAGSTSANEVERGEATEAFMAVLDSMNATGNYIFAGDLNLYSSTEPAYQDLINYLKPGLRFFDPINIPGNWHNSAARAITHTQSTHTSGSCFVTGGMDDRFDFLLTSDEIINDLDKVKYIPNTYQALGQDGNRFNGSIISPTNNSVPSTISNALFNLSDHLPVLMDLEITLPNSTSLKKLNAIQRLKYVNPTKGELLIDLSNQLTKIEKIEIYNLKGQLVASTSSILGNYVQFDLSNLSNGTYFIRTTNSSFQQSVDKLIKI